MRSLSMHQHTMCSLVFTSTHSMCSLSTHEHAITHTYTFKKQLGPSSKHDTNVSAVALRHCAGGKIVLFCCKWLSCVCACVCVCLCVCVCVCAGV